MQRAEGLVILQKLANLRLKLHNYLQITYIEKDPFEFISINTIKQPSAGALERPTSDDSKATSQDHTTSIS